jgi:hypothetical protein
MNLGKLLGAGKSFFGGRGVIAYREDKRVYLPKFNAPKNPFEPKAADGNSAPTPEPKKVSATVVAPTVLAAPKIGTSKIPVFSAPKLMRTTTWAEKLNPFRAPQPVAPMINAVQTELSLDAVKVLHNDLSDADVEVVPVKSRTLAPAESPRLTATREPLEFFRERQLETA